MATEKDRKHRRAKLEELEAQEKQSDLAALWQSMTENPVLFTLAAGFIIACAAAGFLYKAIVAGKDRQYATQLVRALETDDPSLLEAELEPLAQGAGKLTDQALYMLGESAYDAKDYPKAKQAFEQLRKAFPESQFVPDSVEALGFLAENEGQYEQALTFYQEILEKWPNSVAGLRQPLNVARCQEHLNKLADAVASYRVQTEMFPGSTAFAKATAALQRLRRTNPELFPEPTKTEASAGGVQPGAAEQAPSASVDVTAPAEAGQAVESGPAGAGQAKTESLPEAGQAPTTSPPGAAQSPAQ